MKTTLISNRLFSLGLLLVAMSFLAAPRARAGLSVVLELAHDVDNFSPPFSQTNYQILLWDVEPDPSVLPAAPLGGYVISSPSGAIAESFQLTGGGISDVDGSDSAVFFDYASFIHELTNGNWTIVVTNGVSTNTYRFSLTTPGFDSNSLPLVNVTFPLAGAVNITNNPNFTWKAIPWGGGNIQVEDNNGESGFFEENILGISQTNWLTPATLPDGPNTLTVSYSSPSSSSIIVASTPTNSSAQSIGMNFQSFLVTYAGSTFTVANHSVGHPGSTPLVARYTFNDGNIAATDASGNGNTLLGYYNDGSGSISITNDALEGAHAVAFSAPFGFSGGNYYSDDTNLLSALAGSFSVSLWLKTAQVSGNDTDAGVFSGAGIVSALAQNNANGTNYVIPMVLTGHKLAFVTVGGGGSAKDTLHSATSIDTSGDYVHVVVTRDQATGAKKIYINGELDASDTGTTDLLNGSAFLQIGLNNGQGLNGEIDDIQIYSAVLSDSEVMQLYDNPGTTAILDLTSALDDPDLTWTTNGNTGWFPEAITTYDDVSAAQSGPVTGSQNSVLSTTVTGPGNLTFWWLTEVSGPQFDLEFDVDGFDTADNNIADTDEWVQQPSVFIPAGTHTLSWTAHANGSADPTQAGWLDQVQFTPTNSPPGHVLVAYYSFEDGNLAATDFSGYGNTLPFPFSINGASASITSDAKAGDDAMLFSNNGGAGETFFYGSYSDVLSTLWGSFTASMWIKTSQISGNNTDDGIYNNAGLMSAFNNPGTNFVIPMSITGHKLAFVTVGGGGTVTDTLHSTTNIDNGTYIHVVVTRDQTTGAKKIFVNGNLDASDTGTTDLLTGPIQFNLGANNGNGYNGEMDDVQIYSGVLSSTEISQLFNNPGTTIPNTTAGPPQPVSVTLTLQVQRYESSAFGSLYYQATPFITSISPLPITTNRLESSDGQTFCEVWAGDSSYDNLNGEAFSTLDQLLMACTNHPWTLYINKGDPSQQIFHFNISAIGLTTNVLAPVTLIVPTNGAVNVPTNSPFQWSGPSNYSSVFVESYQAAAPFTIFGTASLPGTATNWPSPPALLYGTNYFYISFSTYDVSSMTLSTPVDVSSNPVADWNSEVDLFSDVFSTYVAGAPAPAPVQLSGSPSPVTGGNFQLSFQTLAGRPEILQMRTNLTKGTWTDVTNFIGDGSTHQISLPTTNAPGEYFRIVTQ